MEPGEYLTNVLTFNNYTSISYHYFEPHAPPSTLSRKHLQKLEAIWRGEGQLVHCDALTGCIWLFRDALHKAEGPQCEASELSALMEDRGLKISLKESGTYEPVSLSRNKQIIPNLVKTPSTGSSQSSLLDSTVRSGQNSNARSSHTNGVLSGREPLTPSSGTVSATVVVPPTSPKKIHEAFISSVLSSVVYFLCKDHHCIPLNSRTLVLPGHPANTMSSSVELASLDISLTSMGFLVVKACIDQAPGLQSNPSQLTAIDKLDGLAVGSALWLAPGGNAAKFASLPDDVHSPSGLSSFQLQDTRESQRSQRSIAATIKSWQSNCLEWLGEKGLDPATVQASGWFYVEILTNNLPYDLPSNQNPWSSEEVTILPWPALLCFRASSFKSLKLQAKSDSSTNRRDPLAFAEDWLTGSEERAHMISKRIKERQAAENLSKEQADADVRMTQSHIYPSATLRRGSNAGAIYPTPPDAPQPIGVTPYFDGNASTPGNPGPFLPTEVTNSSMSNMAVADADADLWGPSAKKDSKSSVLSMHEGVSQDHDNLFGEAAGDLFGHDITDADFSFFDEPDNIQLDENVNVSLNIPIKGTLPDAMVWVENSDQKLKNAELLIANAIEAVGELDQVKPLNELSRNITLTDGDLVDASDDIPIEGKNNDANTEQSSATIPFNKETVFNKLSQGFLESMNLDAPRRASSFNEVQFQDSLDAINEKYGSRGRFQFSAHNKRPQSDLSKTIPQTEYLGKRRKTQDTDSEMRSLARILVPNKDVKSEEEDAIDFSNEAGGATDTFEPDDTITFEGDNVLLPDSRHKRKWNSEMNLTLSSPTLAMDHESTVTTPRSIHNSQIHILEPDPASWSLTPYFTSYVPRARSVKLSDSERIATAQVLADQAITSTLPFPGISSNGISPLLTKTSMTRRFMTTLSKSTKFSSETVSSCSLQSVIEIQSVPAISQALRLPPRPMANPRGPNGTEPTKQNNPYLIPPPQLEVRRSETKLSILPSAIIFWENLGLGPAEGPKDVQAVCVYSNLDGMTLNASIFLDQMRSVYETSRLGSHDRLMTKDIQEGLMPIPLDTSQEDHGINLAALRDTIVRLSRGLVSGSESKKNFVVYFIYPKGDSNAVVQICSAFHQLFKMYQKLLAERRLTPSNDLVLQLIPTKFIVNPTSLAIPLPSEYFNLAIEVYDRCTNFSSTLSTPAIMLEQPLPKSIDFKLTAVPSASVLQENTCLHIAYAQSVDDRWITAAWTDNRGTQQMTASYCLGRKNEALSMSFSDVANEIWETTLAFLRGKKIHWRLMIARVGVMEPSEVEFWTSLASTEINAQISLTLITVQTDPSLRILPPPASILPNGAAAVSSSQQSTVTPVSTPQSTLVPETATPPSSHSTNTNTTNTVPPSTDTTTNPLDPPPTARLHDLTTTTHGLILSHRLSNTHSLLAHLDTPALISGYLLKRSGAHTTAPPLLLEVNIIHAEVLGNPRTFHEALLREVLGYYAGLACLAGVRGVTGLRGEGSGGGMGWDGRPWHVAAAEKGVRALYMAM